MKHCLVAVLALGFLAATALSACGEVREGIMPGPGPGDDDSTDDCGGCPAGQACVEATCVGQGALRFTLSWGVPTDCDIHLITPSGVEIYWNNPFADGGELDVDDLGNGALVENIFFNSAPRGEYQYWAENYAGESEVPYTMEVATPSGRISNHIATLPAVPRAQGEHFFIDFQ